MYGGAPGSGNKNAQTHGLYTREAITQRRQLDGATGPVNVSGLRNRDLVAAQSLSDDIQATRQGSIPEALGAV